MTLQFSKTVTFLTFYILFIQLVLSSFIPLLIVMPIEVLQAAQYFGMLLILLLFLKDAKLEYRMLLIVIAALLSILVNNIPEQYNAPVRLVLWVLVVSSVGPLVYNLQLIRLRNKLLTGILIGFMLMGALSFIYWILGFPQLGKGRFSGLAIHSMILAPIAAVGGLYAFYLFTESVKKRWRTLFLIFFVLNIFSILLAGSRTAFIGFVVGFIVYLFFSRFRFRKLLIFLSMLLIVVVVIIKNESEVLISTNSDANYIGSDITERGLQNTREELWDDRIREFVNYPIFGVGFASQNDEFTNRKGRAITGSIEPGSTYLMILSMTGIIGASAVFVFFLKPLSSKRFWKRISSMQRYKLAVLLFFAVHFIAEGYIFSSGSLMGWVFWLLLGSIYPYKNINYEKV
ncbi:O-antigen ligase family protein [Sulfurovum sp.]|uniref:O-antigen ligase family protein n=1 Tax=Sulfurovum sp. TaxID=1969726 RepID=UPI0035695BF7